VLVLKWEDVRGDEEGIIQLLTHRDLVNLSSPDGVFTDREVVDFELHDFGSVIDDLAIGLGEVAMEWQEGRGFRSYRGQGE